MSGPDADFYPDPTAAPLALVPVHADVCEVFDAEGQRVGVLKRIAGRWKFKALGHGPQGELVPGGGPFTHHHNAVFDRLDATEVSACLRQ